MGHNPWPWGLRETQIQRAKLNTPVCTKCSNRQKIGRLGCDVLKEGLGNSRGKEGHPSTKAQEHGLTVPIKNSEHGVHTKGRRRGNLKLHLTLENRVRHNTEVGCPVTGHRTWLGQWVWVVASQRTRCKCPSATLSWVLFQGTGKGSFLCCHESRRNQKLEYQLENLLERPTSSIIYQGPGFRLNFLECR